MRPTVIGLGAALALAACDASTVFFAEGVDLATREADLAQCEALALTEFPVRSQTRFTPRIFVPPETICSASGTCIVRPGYFDGGVPYSVDVNAEFRRTATRGCMGERGYARVGLPFCAPETRVQPSTVMPPLTEGTCLFRWTGDGPPLIVNPI